MSVTAYSPPPPLGAWVSAIWYFEGPEIRHATERILPGGAMQILVNLSTDELRWSNSVHAGCVQHLPGAALAGAFAGAFTIDTAQQRMITGVSFAPGGAAAFFPGSMREFANDHVALSDFPGCGSIRDELLEARGRGIAQVINTWEQFLNSRWTDERRRGISFACRRLEQGSSVQQVADLMSLSVRKFRQNFAESVGLAPKAFARVSRLSRLVRCIASGEGDRDWAALALSSGYFDQAHMIHDFRALTGVTPANYLPLSAEDWNHSVEPDADSYNTHSEASARKG